jgi:hypothetical protein
MQQQRGAAPLVAKVVKFRLAHSCVDGGGSCDCQLDGYSTNLSLLQYNMVHDCPTSTVLLHD